MQMPGLNGIDLLRAFEKLCGATTRIMLTGQTDLATAMEAVNHGHVYRFLTKPCAIGALEATIDAGIAQYNLVTAEKVLLEETLAGSVQTRDLLGVEALKTGMVLASDIFTLEGMVLLTAGTRLSGFHLEKLRSMRSLHGIEEPVLVLPCDLLA
jgi:DNA-binding response OmpR family regulator